MKVWTWISAILCSILLVICVLGAITILKMSDNISDLKDQISTAETNISTLQSSYNELSVQNESLTTERDKLSEEKSTLETENESLNLEIERISTEFADSAAKISNLEGQIQTKDKDIADLQTKIKNLNSKVSSLESQIKDLKNTKPDNNQSTEQPKNEGQGTSSEKVAYLTFDDGISSYTNSILDTLKEYNVKATFFVNWKSWVSGYDKIYKRIIDEGHTLANHTATHDFDTVYSTIEGFENEVMTLHNNIKKLTGYEMKLFRFPGGSNASYTKKLGTQLHTKIHELGYEYYDWNIDSGDTSKKGDPDGDGHNVPVDVLVKNVLNGATSNTATILMHDLGSYKKTTIEALPQIIKGLRDKGYTLKAMDESVTPRQFTKDPNQ